MINIWAVLVAGVAYYILGFLWYSPFLFGKAWMKSLGKTQDELSFGPKELIGSIIVALIIPLIVAFILELICTWDLIIAVLVSILVFVVMACIMLNSYLYGGMNIKTFLINSGYQICGLLLIGLIIGLWKL